MLRYFRAFITVHCFLLLSCTIHCNGQSEKFLNGFIDFLNNLPNQPYVYEDGLLINSQNTGENAYKIEVSLKVSESKDPKSFKLLKCTATIHDEGDNGITVDPNGHECHEDIVVPKNDKEVTDWEQAPGTDEATTTDVPIQEVPVKLDNEVQSDTAVTSGEQFIAIPRHSPNAPCIGCSSHVNPSAPGVHELAILGIRHLDRHEPNVRHSLLSVVDVERQVQIVNGVRYILTLNINNDNCTSLDTEGCRVNKTCKISTLEKPWVKLPDGSKFRAILANNCTEQWQFGDDGEVLSDNSDGRQENKDKNELDPLHNQGGGNDGPDSEIKAYHQADIQAQPNLERTLTDDQIKQLEEQIVPNQQDSAQAEEFEVTTPFVVDKSPDKTVFQQEVVDSFAGNSVPQDKASKVDAHDKTNDLTEDKKKAIDDLVNFFNYAGFDTNPIQETTEKTRLRRSYDSDLKVLSLVEKYSSIKRKLDDARNVYTLGDILVHYLNEIDMEVKSRVLKEVITAEEEYENHQHFVYLQARIYIPCEKDCESNTNTTKICNAVIDNTDPSFPQVLNHFCYRDENKLFSKIKISGVPLDDPILRKLSEKALIKIETESTSPNAMVIKKIRDASTRRGSGVITKIALEMVYTNCSKSVPLYRRENCTVLGTLGEKLCEVIVHDRPWLNEKKITYTCTEQTPEEKISTKFISSSNTNVKDPKVLEMVQDALQYLEMKSNRNNKQKIVEISKVSTKLVAGLLTDVQFVVGYTTCKNELDTNLDTCELLKGEPLRNCHAQIWDRSWLEDGKQVNVTCDDTDLEKKNIDENLISRKKRSVIIMPYKDSHDKKHDSFNRYKRENLVGGQLIQDKNDPKYLQMAEESLQKYCQDSGATVDHKLVSVDKVTTQVVSGLLTRIDFTIAPAKGQDGDNIKCHSKVWEQSWLKKKEITVNCSLNNKQKRNAPNLAGSPMEQNPRDPKYMALATESMQKFLLNTGNIKKHNIVAIDKVTLQTVAGTMTRMDFRIIPDDGQDGDIIFCHSEIWERPWLNKKEISVNCSLNNRVKRGTLGGLKEQNPNDPKYQAMATEALKIYLQNVGNTVDHELVSVDKVTTQVVSGLLTRIDFTITPAKGEDGDNIKCHSKVWEQSWLTKKEISVNCTLNNKQKRNAPNLAGSPMEKNPKDPKYKAMAEESLQKYCQDSGTTVDHKLVSVDKVTTQVVSGLLTRIDFTIAPAKGEDGDNIKCHSKVWEQPWLNKKEITVNCSLNNRQKRNAPNLAGSPMEKNPKDPKYKAMAEESLQKYCQDSGTTVDHKLVSVDKVTTQVVSGLLTKMDFTITPAKGEDGDNIKCHSEVWEQPWLKKKEFTVNCNLNNKQKRDAPNQPGSAVEQNPKDPKYKAMAEESLQKYCQDSGTTVDHKLVSVDKVTTQVVSGLLTKMDFTITPAKGEDGDNIKCHSEVWEQPWLKKKEFTVNCNLNNKQKRDAPNQPGSAVEQNPKDPKYKAMAEESLQKYCQDSGTTVDHKLVSVDKVTTQVVSGLLTKMDFTITPAKGEDGDNIKCHSEVWEQPWIKKKEVTVNCNLNNKQKRDAPDPPGSAVEKNPNDPKYVALAVECMKKYETDTGNNINHRLLDVSHVTVQIVSGTITRMHFTITPDYEETGDTIGCYSEIWERPWLNKKEITVNCNLENRKKRSIIPSSKYLEKEGLSLKNELPTFGAVQEQDPDEEYHKHLAEETLRKYQLLHGMKYAHKIIKVERVLRQIVEGTLYKIDYTATPTLCLTTDVPNSIARDGCELQHPNLLLKCHGEVWERSWLEDGTETNVTCAIENDNFLTDNDARFKRQLKPGEYEIEEDTKFYYADRAIQDLNEHSDTNNMHKLVTIHDTHTSMHMGTMLIRMYIEAAYTFCVKQDSGYDLNDCEEIEGLSHRLCLVKISPAPEDDLVIKSITVVCDDDKNFERVSGISILQLIQASIKQLEKSETIIYKLVHQGEPNIVPTLDINEPFKLSFIVRATNCTKNFKVSTLENPLNPDYYTSCFVTDGIPPSTCHSWVWLKPNNKGIRWVKADCEPTRARTKRSVDLHSVSPEDSYVQQLVQESIEKLEMETMHRYKQRVVQINSYTSKITTGKVTTIDFDVGYTSCLKYEWVDNVTRCEFLEHLPRRHCISNIYERLWIDNGKNIDVNCEDDETPLEAHIEFESAETATLLANVALKHIEAKYPHPRKQKVVRIFSLEKQQIAGLHYRLKVEVGFTNCVALTARTDCSLVNDMGLNKFCRVNVWIRPWTNHPPNFRVTCDYQDSATGEMYHHIQAEHIFYDFITTYKPAYSDDHNEMKRRFEIFKANIRKIHDLNTHEQGTASYAVTKFTDLTYEEFRAKYLGLRPDLEDPNQIPTMPATIPKIEIPEAFDWRQYDTVTEVKDQGSCGSCWAFSVTGNIEGQYKIQTGKLVSLSEQELVDCDKLDNGCNGGLPDNAYRAIEQLGGLELENDYPYEGEDDKCVFNRSLSRVKISGAVNITSNESSMAQWLVKNGPISIGINANAMQFYMGGVSHPWKMLCNPTNIDHGVLIVGYGVSDYPLFHKKLPYWIVKNSWGKLWGEQGYYRVYRGDGTCGVNQMASSAIVSGADEFAANEL